MKKLFLGICCIVLLPVVSGANPYRSLNEICVVAKKGDDYWFLNRKELAAKAEQWTGAQRDSFEWFFTENGQIVAKVYPALRDAIIATPDELYKQRIDACELTDTNQKLAARSSFKYNSKDKVCVCLLNESKVNCGINESQLRKVPYERWVLFFETGGYPSVISEIVPPVLSKAWGDIPDDYMQRISPCSNNTSNEEIVKQLEPQVRNLNRW